MNNPRFSSRRAFLRLSATAAGAALLAACASTASPSPTTAPQATTAPAAASTPAGAATPAAAATTAPAAATPATQAASSAKSSITLHILETPNNTVQAMNDDYKKKTGVTVDEEVIPQGVDQTAKMVTALQAGGTAYDVVRVDVIDLALYAVSNWIEDVTSRITKDMQEDILPFAKQAVTYKGKWYGMPKDSEWKTWVYNEKMLKDAGIASPPETWTDYVEASKTIMGKKLAKYGQTWGWKQGENIACDYPMLVKNFGGEFMSDNDDLLVNQAPGVEALQAMVDWVNKDKIVDPASLTADNTAARNPQAAGDTAFGLHWGTPVAIFNDASKSKVTGQTKAGLAPHKTGGASWTVSGPECWAISKGSANKDQGWDYLQFRQGKDGSKRQFLGEGSMFAWKSLYSDPEMQAFAKKSEIDFDVAQKQSENIVNRPMIPWYYDYSAALQLELQNALTQKKQPKAALDDAVAAYAKVRAKATGK